MADMIHGWWLDRAYVETNVSFEPLRDENGRSKFIEYAGSGNYTQYGNIITTVFRFAELIAVTIGVDAPSTDLILSSGVDSGKLVVSGPQLSTIKIEPITGSAWQQYNSVETTLADGILNLFSHSVKFRCGTRTVTQGMYNELDAPPIDEPT